MKNYWLIFALIFFQMGCNKSGLAPGLGLRMKYIYAVGGAQLYGYSIDSISGLLTPVSGGSFAVCTGNCNSTMAYDGQRDLLFVSDGSRVNLVSANPTTGALTKVASVASTATVLMSLSNYNLLYGIDSSALDVFSYSPSGIAPVFGSPFPLSSTGSKMAADVYQRYFFIQFNTSNWGTEQFNNQGVVSLTSQAAGSFGFAGGFVDLTGHTLITQGAGAIDLYSINQATGALTVGPTYTAPIESDWMTADRVNKFLFNLDVSTPSIDIYRINSNGASLTYLSTNSSGFASPNSLSSMVADPDGKFLYIPNSSNTGLNVFSVDQSSGSLTLVQGPVLNTRSTSPFICIWSL